MVFFLFFIFFMHDDKISADDLFKYFSYFSQKISFGILCKTICKKCGKNEKNNISLSSAEFIYFFNIYHCLLKFQEVKD